LVEPIGEGAEVGLDVLAVLQRFEGARHHGLEVAQHGFDPLELGQERSDYGLSGSLDEPAQAGF